MKKFNIFDQNQGLTPFAIIQIWQLYKIDIL